MSTNGSSQGMTEDLNLKDADYNIAVSIFFIPYVIFGICHCPKEGASSSTNVWAELPSNTLLVRFQKPSHYIGFLTVAWG